MRQVLGCREMLQRDSVSKLYLNHLSYISSDLDMIGKNQEL